jgi:hypothetical protein
MLVTNHKARVDLLLQYRKATPALNKSIMLHRLSIQERRQSCDTRIFTGMPLFRFAGVMMLFGKTPASGKVMRSTVSPP